MLVYLFCRFFGNSKISVKRQENLINTHDVRKAGTLAGSCDKTFFIWLEQDLRSKRPCTPAFVAPPSMSTQVEVIGIDHKLLKRDNLSLLQSGRYISFDHPAWAATSSSGIESGESKVSNRSDGLPSVSFSEA
jgi:hypothetical protein